MTNCEARSLNSAWGCPELALEIDKRNIRLKSHRAYVLQELAIRVPEGIKTFSCPRQLSDGRGERYSD
jgi:hypothetical protein